MVNKKQDKKQENTQKLINDLNDEAIKGLRKLLIKSLKLNKVILYEWKVSTIFGFILTILYFSLGLLIGVLL